MTSSSQLRGRPLTSVLVQPRRPVRFDESCDTSSYPVYRSFYADESLNRLLPPKPLRLQLRIVPLTLSPSSHITLNHSMSTPADTAHRMTAYNKQPLDIPLQITDDENEFFKLTTGIHDTADLYAHITKVQQEAYEDVSTRA